jgi:hypothetical protein
MLTGSRATGKLDVNRLSKAVERPGIDPRVWACRAVVTRVVADRDHGVLVDVVLLPSGIEETAKIAPLYAGAGFGLYLPARPDDEVLVWAPNGNPDDGLEVVARVWDGADPPPAEVADHPDDVLLFVRPGQTLRLVVADGGDVVVDARGAGVVKLGSEVDAELRRGAREGDSIAIAGSDLAALQANLDGRYTVGAGAPLSAVAGAIDSGSDKVRVK